MTTAQKIKKLRDVRSVSGRRGKYDPARAMNLTLKPWLFLTLLLYPLSGTAAVSTPSSNCPHVQVLEAGDTDQISWEHDGGVLSDNSRLMDPRPNQLKALGEALDMMPPVLCNAVHKVAFIYRPPKEGKTTVVDAWTKSNDRQNLVYLNTWDDLFWNQNNINLRPSFRAAAIQRMIHESTHCAIRMIQSQQSARPVGMLQERPDESLWSASGQSLANEVIRKNRLDMGLLREWQRIHDAFVAADMSTPYWGDDWPTMRNNMTAEHITAAGFTSAYGGDKAMEDIAEMTSWAIVRGTAANPEDAACRIMNRRPGSTINQDDAAIFTKLGFLQTLGFISEDAYKDCVGRLSINPPRPGFHTLKDGNLTRSYTGNMKGGLGRSGENGPIMFTLSGDGTVETSSDVFHVTMTLSLNVSAHIIDLSQGSDPYGHVSTDDVSFARGIYFLGSRHGKYNRLAIHRKSDNALIMDVGQGVVLVNRSSLELFEGSNAVQRIFNYSGGLLSAIAGDEPVKDPTKITFRYKPQSN